MAVRLFTPESSAVVLIDHQVGTMGWVRSTDPARLKRNALALAKAAKALDLPLVLTTSLEEEVQGPLAEEFREVAPEEYAARVRRSGAVDAMEDPDFAAAVEATGRRDLIVAGVTNDVCTVHPTVTALEAGYRVEVVADAGGSTTWQADDIAVRRMAAAGAGITTTNLILTTLARHWGSPAGRKLQPIVAGLIPA
ncbi:isochorismatase family protein [Actinosynnema sp. NPDC047251]|uniref:Isochorismatase hydrolase n=1 Tax=Saccharothrix espanaensis (strain ATCC 51144 / DSM 44229 / JCM 9112 / NBRC 15066 / NRRL 15764) TaxID=1179773 RepID=K0JVA4_SACES|nr:isochorismatase family protein [Saccharothrix espanaensis]CCH31800.1 Isochorismatase hydrolase [Saccharothrix espanaensis DSM 44229]